MMLQTSNSQSASRRRSKSIYLKCTGLLIQKLWAEPGNLGFNKPPGQFRTTVVGEYLSLPKDKLLNDKGLQNSMYEQCVPILNTYIKTHIEKGQEDFVPRR